MIYPKFIKKGDKIGVTATSAGNGDELHLRILKFSEDAFAQKGYGVIETQNVRTDYKLRSSSKEERAKQLMDLVEDKSINAIITARGGEFLIEILPYVNFETIKSNPKWIQGYSDTTGIGFCVTTLTDIATIYGENFGSFAMQPWHEALNKNLDLLEGKNFVQESFDLYQANWQEEIVGNETWETTEKVSWKNARGENEIKITGRLIGGCIDVLTKIVGTKFDRVKDFCNKYKNDGIIWFFDNCELSSEDMLRSLWQMKEAGWFNNIKGIVFGRTMTRKSNCEISFEEAVLDATEELSIPIIFDADIGHLPPQMTLINGAIAKIESKDGKGKIEFVLA